MRHIFAKIDDPRYPIPGDLVRSLNTPDFINIVLSISPEQEQEVAPDLIIKFKYIRSVRYGHTNCRKFKILYGQRSRSFKWYRETNTERFIRDYLRNTWEIVEEYTPYDNTQLRIKIVTSLQYVDTAYRAEEEDDE
jgi:hypothetical protein